MKRQFSASVWREGRWFVAQCLEIDVASQGESEDEAVNNLREALKLHFEPPVATVAPQSQAIAVTAGATQRTVGHHLSGNHPRPGRCRGGFETRPYKDGGRTNQRGRRS